MLLRKFLALFALSGLMLASACNTVHGATEDVESVGDCVDGAEGNC